MPVVNIVTWPVNDDIAAKNLVADITKSVHKNTGAPLDKISVYITEVSPAHWGDAGILGTDPDFPTRSRRQHYGDRGER